MGTVLLIVLAVLVLVAVGQAVRLAVKGDRGPITYIAVAVALGAAYLLMVRSTGS